MVKQISIAAVITLLSLNAAVVYPADQPYIGYVYPAGGQQGHEVLITAGGQFLRQPKQVYVSGTGVSGTIVKHYPPLGNLQKEQREYIQSRLKEVRESLLSGAPAAIQDPNSQNMPSSPSGPVDTTGSQKENPEKLPNKVKMPDHPLLYDLESKSLRQLAHVQQVMLRPASKIQPNRQIAETVLIRLTIAPDAEPGFRELRLVTAVGLTNPMTLQIGTLAEYSEAEPNDEEPYPTSVPRGGELPAENALELPIILNGQILPGDIDRFRFRAEAGQNLVIAAHARRLIPYLADAVPGWFQAVLSLYDAAGNEIAFADDYRFDPDPVLYYQISKTGDYELVIHDSIYRGREDFVYRVSIGQLPFITEMFPLGAKEGQNITASIKGWNLTEDQLSLDTSGSTESIRTAVLRQNGHISNPVAYAVDTLPEINEAQSHDHIAAAQQVKIPAVVNGCIDSPGQTDVYKFSGKKDDEITVEVMARRLNSPLDSLLQLTDKSGKSITWNDDYYQKSSDFVFKDTEGLLTHHADSLVTAKLPAEGTYYLHVTDSQGHGGSAYGYRLRITPQTPDFALRVTPSGISALPGAFVPITVHVLSKNKFNGPIEMFLNDAPSGFELQGRVIPPGKDRIRMTIRVGEKSSGGLVSLKLEGRARIGDSVVTRPAVGAEDKMQAFLYRHLVPSKDMAVFVQNVNRTVPLIERTEDGIVDIPLGGFAQVYLKSSARPLLRQLHLQLQNPPDGVSVHGATVVPQGVTFLLKAQDLEKGFTDNLIIEAYRKTTVKDPDGKLPDKTQLQYVGPLAAITVRVTDPSIPKTAPGDLPLVADTVAQSSR